MRNELIELYQLACANPNDKDIVRSYQRAKDRIGPQIAVYEAMDADSLRARVARLEEIAVHVYNSGYHAGHNDTVECRYIDIYPSDMDSYHAEDVADLVRTLEEK